MKELRTFCHVARLGNITRAAEHVGLSQPALSIHLRFLEEYLGVTLLERNGPRIALTGAGRRFYARALPLVEGLDRLQGTFAERFECRAGALRIAATETAAACLLPPCLARLAEWHGAPETCVRMGNATQCLGWLRAYEADIAFVTMDVARPDVDFHPLHDAPWVLITPPGHPLSDQPFARPHDLGAQPLVVPARASALGAALDLHLHRHGVAPDVAVEIDGWEAITACVEAGLGLALVPDLCLAPRDRVGSVPYDGDLPPRRYGYATRRDEPLPLAVEWLVQAAAERPGAREHAQADRSP